MSAWTDLAAAVERTEGASREIDARIWYLAVEKPRPGDKVDQDMIGRWPLYTASVDAALALIEQRADEWTSWNIESRRRRTAFRAEMARLTDDPENDEERITGRGATPAMALLAAFCRAMAAREQNGGER